MKEDVVLVLCDNCIGPDKGAMRRPLLLLFTVEFWPLLTTHKSAHTHDRHTNPSHQAEVAGGFRISRCRLRWQTGKQVATTRIDFPNGISDLK